MIDNPLVSVCVVTYQHVNYIKQCLDGILMQETTFPFEIVLGEDESTDGTREICVSYATRYPDIIKLFLRKREDVIFINGHPTGRYNFIENLKACNGKYIALCEGDDYWTDPLKLQKQVDFLENNPKYVLSGHNAFVVDSKNKILNDSHLKPDRMKDCTNYELMAGRHIITLTMCFRNVIAFFPKEFYKSLNGDTFLVALLGQYGHYKFQEEIGNGAYRLHSGGMWSNKNETIHTKSKMDTYFNMFYYFKNKTIKKVTNDLFNKYVNTARNLILSEISSKKYFNVFVLFIKLNFNCLIHRFYKKAIRTSVYILRKLF